MGVMSVRVDESKQKALKIIASIEGKSMGSIVSELIEKYVIENQDKIRNLPQNINLTNIMKMSEASFMEWDNEEDKIYDKL